MGAGGTTLEEVRKRYRRAAPEVLSGVDLHLPPGTVTVVVGGNGSGKSTLLRIAAGVSPATSGRVGRDVRGTGYAPERLPARLRMSGRTYLTHMARLRGLADPGRAAAGLLDALEVRPGPDVAIRTLSKGNSQKLALAQALLAPVGLLALDEPLSGLDADAAGALARLVAHRIAEGTAVLVATQHPDGWGDPTATYALADGRLTPTASAGGTVRVVVATTLTVDLPGVLGPSADGQAILVSAPAVDDVLRWALGHGHTVVSVVPQ